MSKKQHQWAVQIEMIRHEAFDLYSSDHSMIWVASFCAHLISGKVWRRDWWKSLDLCFTRSGFKGSGYSIWRWRMRKNFILVYPSQINHISLHQWVYFQLYILVELWGYEVNVLWCSARLQCWINCRSIWLAPLFHRLLLLFEKDSDFAFEFKKKLNDH